jgi:hypothetical protein
MCLCIAIPKVDSIKSVKQGESESNAWLHFGVCREIGEQCLALFAVDSKEERLYCQTYGGFTYSYFINRME